MLKFGGGHVVLGGFTAATKNQKNRLIRINIRRRLKRPCPRSMRSRVHVTIRCPSVCPVAAADEQLWHSPVAGNRVWQHEAAARRSAANAGSAMFTA